MEKTPSHDPRSQELATPLSCGFGAFGDGPDY